ncbi:MAG: protein kinase [Candidatus Eisenbacteria bacterium]|nr:protein kinase [Candidatus Eisenbacteria bacterium]
MVLQDGTMLSHYRLLAKIGEGGMGVVWKAEDTILRRIVAIKLLPSERSMDRQRRRMFLEEARIAASVVHSHIVQVYELGREDAVDFIVMEYVDGAPLSRILDGAPMSPDRVVDLSTQIAQGLVRAHQVGLIHRDLKPANIMITAEGDAKIVDFGLATYIEAVQATTMSFGASTPLTLDERLASRPLAGTLPYMSPEQVRGEKLDARSDIFSFGSVMYEMTTGVRPFQGITPSDLAARIVSAEPPPVHDCVPAVPLDLERIIGKTLAKKPADRYQVVADLAVDLKHLRKDLDSGVSVSYRQLRKQSEDRAKRIKRWIVSACVSAAVTLGGLGVWWQARHQPEPAGAGAGAGANAVSRTVLVIPMDVVGQAEGAEIVGRAFAEAIAINLAETANLAVLPVPSVSEIPRATGRSLARAARKLGAEIVLSGSLLREGRTVKATITAVDTKRNRVLCGTQGTDNEGDLARVASSTASTLLGQLGIVRPKQYDYFRYLTWTPAMASLPDFPSAVLALRQHDVPKGLAYTREIVDAFPQQYEAHMMRAVALCDAENVDPSERTLQAFHEELDTLHRIDPMSPVVDLFRAQLYRETEPSRGLRMLNQLLVRRDLTPSFRSHVLRERSGYQETMDSSSAARRSLEEAVRLDPANTFNYHYFGSWLIEHQRYAEAAENAQHALALDPFYAGTYTLLGKAEEGLGQVEEALKAYRTACDVWPVQSTWASYALALQRMGRAQESTEAAVTAASESETGAGSYGLAAFWAMHGDRDRALRFLRRSMELGRIPSDAQEDERFRSLLADAEFRKIVLEAQRLQQLTDENTRR